MRSKVKTIIPKERTIKFKNLQSGDYFIYTDKVCVKLPNGQYLYLHNGEGSNMNPEGDIVQVDVEIRVTG
jgi:hypothetical protein